MTDFPFDAADLEILRQWDTPTICNGLELIVPERRAVGFTTVPMVAANPKLKPIIGLARTGMIRSKERPRGNVPDRGDTYAYMAAKGLPTVTVLQDIDDRPGYGAYWGEVQSTVHLALGVAGCVTNGSFRDTDMLAPGFQIIGCGVVPSHAHVHLVEFGCEVNVLGMHCVHDDVVHADHHGAVVIPADCVKRLVAAIDLITRREAVILEAAKSEGFNAETLRAVLKRSGEIH
jgi:regulator of RNase E activity RraA